MSLSVGGGNGFHLENFQKLEFVHEASEGSGPALGNGLDVLNLFNINIDGFKVSVFLGLFLSGGLVE